jgi:aerotaxis receptor
VTDVETLLPDNEFIYSRTDPKGVIVEANEAFAAISGFPRETMIGQPHNIVRHPDMPIEAFADMWRTLETGRPWRGFVKNRRQDGGYYWVIANVSPVRENGRIIGYQSVRTRPAREEIAAVAQAYQRIRAGDRSIRIEQGRVVRQSETLWEKFNSLRVQLLLCAFSSLILGALLVAQPLVVPEILLRHIVLAFLGGFSMCAGFIALFVFLPRWLKDLHQLQDWLARTLYNGDLSQRLEFRRMDTLGRVSRDMDCLVAALQATLQGIADTTRQVREAASSVEKSVVNVHQSASVQNEATASAAAGIEEITVSIGEVAAHASSTREAALGAAEVAGHGQALSAQASATILSLAETVKTSAAQVEQLGTRSEEISRITGVIKEIADQTNLLALNAAIEAARAGEAGRGFAVVADEVRKLAERTTKATGEISTMIHSVQQETSDAVHSMRVGAEQVQEGVTLVQEAQGALQQINRHMGITVEMVNDISHSSQEQESAITLMARNVERVAAMTEQNVSVVDHTSQTVEQLNALVERLKKTVNQYVI